MFTQLNQYHVVLEVEPQFQQTIRRILNEHLRRSPPTRAEPGAARARSRTSSADPATRRSVDRTIRAISRR